MNQLRDYQLDVLNQLDERTRLGETEVVIAAAPSSGKTFMMIQFIKERPTKTFIVLTHATNVLKTQWAEAFKAEGVAASLVPGKEKVLYGIPQGLKTAELPTYDYMIIDEAHEYNFAKSTKVSDGKTYESMINLIKRKAAPIQTIYLTGTPSKFIKDGFTPIIIPAIELIDKGYVSDLYLGMVSTTADLKDINDKGDLTLSSIHRLEQTVQEDMDNLLEAMVKRLKETGLIKSSSNFRKLLDWAPTIGKLHKTMIACASIKQAEQIQKYFVDRSISSTLSTSENDLDSENIQKFIQDKSIKVLVVVQRGILGFNMTDLVNVVDLTGSRNIDRIYQLFARAMRKHPDYPRKYFFKITDEPNRDMMQFYMNAALHLMYKDFISAYNGKNLNGRQIAVMRTTEKKDKKDAGSGSSKPKSNITTYNVDPLFYGTVTAGSFLKDIWNKLGGSANEYASVTFGEIRQMYQAGYIIRNNWTEEMIKEEALKYETRGAFQKGSQSAYQAAHSRGIIDSVCEHMDGNISWTEEMIKEEALKYETRGAFKKGSRSAYQTACKRRILDSICEHMIKKEDK